MPQLLAQHLAGQGYGTHAILPDGLFFNGRRRLAPYVDSQFGFARSQIHDGTAAGATAAARAALDELRRSGEPKALLWVHYFDPHEPYERHPERDFGPGAQERYDAEAAVVDHAVGALLEDLGRLRRPVIVAFTSDHGEEFGEHGGYYHGSSLYEEQVRVPLIIAAPGAAPRRFERAVSLVDVAPALVHLLDAPPLPGSGGQDLSPLLRGESLPEAPVVAEVDTKRMAVSAGGGPAGAGQPLWKGARCRGGADRRPV